MKLGNMTLAVPVHKDTQTTEKLAQQISEKLAEIEAESDRIDTQAFAMLAAYHYAVALDEAKEDQRADNTALVKALDALNSKLQALLKEFEGPGG